jgi:hypothetical protein
MSERQSREQARQGSEGERSESSGEGRGTLDPEVAGSKTALFSNPASRSPGSERSEQPGPSGSGSIPAGAMRVGVV